MLIYFTIRLTTRSCRPEYSHGHARRKPGGKASKFCTVLDEKSGAGHRKDETVIDAVGPRRFPAFPLPIALAYIGASPHHPILDARGHFRLTQQAVTRPCELGATFATWVFTPQRVAVIDPADQRPLLTPIDRWGHTPLTATPLTARAVADITAAHLTGQAPRHIRPPVRKSPENNSFTTESAPVEPLGDDYYEHGIAARKHAHDTLGSVTSALDEVENRADRLLAELLELIEGPM